MPFGSYPTYYSLKVHFSVRDGQVKFKFKVSVSQNFGRGKGVCYQFYSEIYGSQEQMGTTDFFENSKAKE